MRKSAIVFGSAGFIGFFLARRLLSSGYAVTLVDNLARGSADKFFSDLLTSPQARFLNLDINIPSSFDSLGAYDEIYHLAAINGTGNFYRNPLGVLKISILGTMNILDWVAKTGQGRVLFSSSSEVYAGALDLMGSGFPIPTPEEVPLVIAEPTNPRWSYAAGKLCGEVLFHSYMTAGLLSDYCIVRYHNIYGPRMGNSHVIPELLNRISQGERPLKVFGASQTRSFCYVDDAVEATILAMTSPSIDRVYHIGREDGEISICDLAKSLLNVSGIDCPIESLPAPRGSVARRCPSTSKIRALGFVPEISIEEGIFKAYSFYSRGVL